MFMRPAWLAALVLALGVFVVPAVHAQTYTYSLYVNADANPATGCSAGAVSGAEVRLDAIVTGGMSPVVTQITRSRCQGGSFGAPTPIGGGHPVGLGNGTGGGDVIEFADALAQLGPANAARLTLSVVARSATGSDELLNTDSGTPISLGLPAFPLPLLGLPALLLLAGLFIFFGGRMARRRVLLRSISVLMLISGLALAANFVVDGEVSDWSGVNPLATDPAGDATSGESAIDLRALFGAVENGRAYFRIDVSNIRNALPIGSPAAVTTLEDTMVTLTLSAIDPEGAPLTFAIANPPALGTLGAITSLSPTSASVLYTPGTDANGTDTFQFTADDGQGASAPTTATITITPVNDAPSFTAQDPPAVDEDAGAQTATVATAIQPGPATATDETGQALDFIISANSNPALFNGTPSISAAGILSYTPADDMVGTAILTVVLHDDGGTANGGVDTSAPQTITVTVDAVDDAPVVTAGGTLAYTENDPPTVADAGVTITDGDSTNLASATVRVSANYQNGADVLAFANTATISATFDAASGTLSLSGSDTVASYQTALRSVTYANTSADPSIATRTLSWSANDGSSTSAPATSTVLVTAVNNAPVVTAGGSLAYTENNPATPIDAGVTVTDADNANLASASVQVSAGFVTGEDVLAFANANGISGSFNTATGTLSLTGSASVANYQAALRSVTYANSSNNPATAPRTITWIANDGTAASAPVTSTITLTAVNNAPVVTAGGSLAYTENDPATPIDAGLTVTDADNANLASATVQVSAGFVTGEDVLAFTNANGISGSFNTATGTLSLTGSASVANYQAALRNVTYANSSNNPATAPRTITWIANDGAVASAPATSTITVAAVNDAPVVTAGGSLAYTENDPATPIDAGLTVTDADNANLASASVQVSAGFVTGEDVLAFANANGISGSFNTATGTLSLTGSASVANYQAALRSVTYANSSNNPATAPRTITWIANDGAVASAPATSTITITAVNDAPVVTAGGTVNYTEADPAVLVGPAVTVTDADNTDLTGASVQITTGLASAEDILAFTPGAGITGSYSAATGTLILTGTASVASYQTALRSVTYANSSNNPSSTARTLVWLATDGTDASAPATSQVTVVSVNDAPVVIAGGSLAYIEGMPATAIDTGVTVTDADSPDLASASVQVSASFVTGEDVLAFTNANGISGSFNTATGILSLTGSASVANYQAALRSVTYANSSNNPATAPRTITWIVNDGTAASAPATSTITLTAVNNAPVVTAGGSLAYTENDPATPIDAGLTVTDADNANLASASVQVSAGFVTGEDVLAFANANGISGSFNAATGTLSLTGSASVANYQAALRNVTYANSSNNPATAPRTITWIANDGAVASAPATSTITVAAVNDAPVVTAGGSLAYTENDPATPIDAGLTVTDADNANLASASVQVSAGFVTGEDVLAFANANGISGSFNTATGTLSLTGSASVANYQAALRSVTYANSSNNPATAPRTITWIANDGAVASAPATSTITITAVNDAPIVTAGGTVNYTEADPAVLVGPAVTVTDADNTDLTGASVQITTGLASAEDILAFTPGAGITGSYSAATGTLILTGSASVASYQTALRSVTYRNSIALPNTTPRTLVWIVTDGTDTSAPATSQVTVQRLNEAPVIVPGGPLAYTEGTGFVPIAPALLVTDADNANLVGAVVSIANFINGEDALSFVNGGGITGSYNAGSGVLTLTGTATVATYQTALRSVRYGNSSSNPTTTPRTVTWIANDGQTTSAVVSTTITITAINNAPVVVAPATLPVHTHIGIAVAAGATGYLLDPANISDPDSNGFVIGGVVPTTTAFGGVLAITPATGAYAYDPPAGTSTGTDSFQYQVCDNGTPVACSTPVTVQLALSGPRVWFVNPSAAAGGVGTLQRPLQGFAAAATAAAGATDTIFLHSGAYTGGATLGTGVRVIGHSITGASFDAVLGLSPPANSIARPLLGQARPVITTTAAATPGITLGSNNTLRAIEIGNTTGASLAGNNFGSLTLGNGVLISGSGQALALTNGNFAAGSVFEGITSTSGTNNIALLSVSGTVDFGGGALSGSTTGNSALLVNAGSVSLTYSGSITKTTTGYAVDALARTAGTITLSGTLSTTGASGVRAESNTGGSLELSGASKTISSGAANGVQLAGNTNAATIRFSGGGLAITTTTGRGFNAVTGGTVAVEGANNTVTSSANTAVHVESTPIGAANLVFRSVSSTGGPSGIVLDSTGAVGRLEVTGNGTGGSGGTIQNSASHGIRLNATQNPAFGWMNIQNSGGSGVKGQGVVHFSFTNGGINNSGTALQAGDSNIAFNTAVTGTETNLTGNVTITGNVLSNAYYHGVRIDNYAGTLDTVNITGNTVTSSTTTGVGTAGTSNGSAIQIVVSGSAGAAARLMRANIANNVITNFPAGSGIRVQGGNSSPGTPPPVTIGVLNHATDIVRITGNRVAGASAAIRMGTESILATVSGRGEGNFDISTNGTAANPIAHTFGTAISFNALDAGATVSGTINNNYIAPGNTGGGYGIAVGVNGVPASANPTMAVTINGNNISQTDGNGIIAVARATNGVLRAKIQNNTVAVPLGGVRPGIRVDSGNNTVGENTSVCLNISGNTSAGSMGTQGIGLRKQGTVPTTHAFAIHNMSATATPNIEAYVNGLNPGGGGTLLISAESGFTSCQLP